MRVAEGEIVINDSCLRLYVLLVFSTPPSLFTTPRPAFAWDNATVRFASPENELAALTAKLYVAVPSVLHDYVRYQNEAFVKLFHSSCNNLRSSTVNRLQQNGSVIFASIAPLFEKEQSKLKEAGKWPKSTAKREPLTAKDKPKKGKEGKQYKCWAPILYLDPESPLTEELFRNPALIIIALIMLCGPSAAMGDPSACKFDRRNPLQRGKDRATTPGLIAFCAILARFLLSPDSNFPNFTTGATSKIDYLGDFNAYKKFLIKHWDTSGIQDLIEYWDSKVFPNSWGRSMDTGEEPDAGDLDESDDDSDSEPAAFEAPSRPIDEEEDKEDFEAGNTSAFVDLGSGGALPQDDDDDEDDITPVAMTLPADNPSGIGHSPVSLWSPMPAVRGSTSRTNAMLIAAALPRRSFSQSGSAALARQSSSSSRRQATSRLALAPELSVHVSPAHCIPAPDFSQAYKGKGKALLKPITFFCSIDIFPTPGLWPPGHPEKPKRMKKVVREVVQQVEVEETDDEDVQEDESRSSPTCAASVDLSGPSSRLLTHVSAGSNHPGICAPSVEPSTKDTIPPPPTKPKPRPKVAANKDLSKTSGSSEGLIIHAPEVEVLAEELGVVGIAPKVKKKPKPKVAPAAEPRTLRSKKNP
ncbi:hypothetical protein BKA70DRAFT_1451038 [Coprinopsis sp. MPI-PUGE-AT-0042]|nr:hypothetical protein BKA70DRAFT_1451038 [Coprinopsis sp. MPI-PUGE-AT-0042]